MVARRVATVRRRHAQHDSEPKLRHIYKIQVEMSVITDEAGLHNVSPVTVLKAAVGASKTRITQPSCRHQRRPSEAHHSHDGSVH